MSKATQRRARIEFEQRCAARQAVRDAAEAAMTDEQRAERDAAWQADADAHAKTQAFWAAHAALIPSTGIHTLTRKAPTPYLKCPANVYPAWTKKRCRGWTPAERRFPSGYYEGDTMLYVAAFDQANNLVPAHTLG